MSGRATPEQEKLAAKMRVLIEPDPYARIPEEQFTGREVMVDRPATPIHPAVVIAVKMTLPWVKKRK